MSKVFISYSRNDRDFVKDFVKQLESEGIQTWVDWRDIPRGRYWRQAIYDGILSCTFFMPIESPNYLESEMCRMESFLARAYNKRILPIMYVDCYKQAANYQETRHLPEIHHMDYSGSNIYSITMSNEERLQNIISVIQDKVPAVPDYKVYIAFPSKEIDYAVQLWEDLESNGFATWLTTKRFYIGDDWNVGHWSAMRHVKVFLPVLTIDAARSFYMKKEVLLARTLKLPILPVISPTAATESSYIDKMRVALDESHEMRILNETQWFSPLPDYPSMTSELTQLINDILSGKWKLAEEGID